MAHSARRPSIPVPDPDSTIPPWCSGRACHPPQEYPSPLRVTSTDRMAADIGNRRRFYILGSAGQPKRPRYDIQSVSYGSFFDLPPKSAIQRLCDEGGTYLHSGAAIPDLPSPAASWVRPDGNSTFVYRVAAGGCER